MKAWAKYVCQSHKHYSVILQNFEVTDHGCSGCIWTHQNLAKSALHPSWMNNWPFQRSCVIRKMAKYVKISAEKGVYSIFSERGCITGPQRKCFALVQLLAPPLHIIISWIKGQDMEKPNQIQKGMTSKTRFTTKSVLFLLCFYHFNLLIFSTLRLHLNSMLAEGRWWQRLPKQLALQCKGSAK